MSQYQWLEEKAAAAEHCYCEADGNLARAYELVTECSVDREPRFARLVRYEVRNRFIAAAMERIGEAHPFNGKSKSYRWIQWQGQVFNKIGISGDGQLSNPNNYPEDKVRAALRWVGAKAVVTRKEATIRAVATRARRRAKVIHGIAAGILADRQYGPRNFCCICEKALTDSESIQRGIGPECWDHILILIEHEKDRQAVDGNPPP